jgi:integrase
MTTRKLTTKTIENLKPGPARREIPDGGSGLYLVLQPSGARSWAVRYRHAGRPAKLTIGSWPALTLATARKDAANALHELERGSDPAEARKTAKVEAAAAKANTVANICESYIRREGGKLRTVDQLVSILKRHVYPAIGDRPVDSIKRSEIVHMLDRIEDKSGTRMADVTLGVLRCIFHWHEKRSDEFRSPIIRGMERQGASDRRRSRILDDGELRKLWAATADGQTFSALVRFLLLTSARRNEAAAMYWDEINADGVWTLPATRSKTKAEIIRPLSKAALALLTEQPHISAFVFTPNGRAALTNFSRSKANLDAASGIKNWRLHDLRRTARSLLSRAGINSDIAEKCLGHAPSTIIATYDRHRYIDEMRHAFEALASLIERIVDPTDSAVLAFRR